MEELSTKLDKQAKNEEQIMNKRTDGNTGDSLLVTQVLYCMYLSSVSDSFHRNLTNIIQEKQYFRT